MVRCEIARVLRVAAVVIAAGAVSPTSGKPPTPEPRNPILVVGIDGLEWNVVLPLLHAGQLPTIDGLMRRGVFGELRTGEKAVSPAIWASVVTGVEPTKHGIQGFMCEPPDHVGAPRLCTSADRRVKALWDMLGENSLVTHVIGWWQTYPVEPIEGVMVAQTNTLPKSLENSEQPKKGSLYAGIAGQIHPASRTKKIQSLVRDVEQGLDRELRRIFGDAATSSDPASRTLWEESKWAFRADAIYRRVALELLREKDDPADLVLVYFGGTDVVGHRFWRYFEPSLFLDPPAPDLIETLGEIIPDYYREMDRVLGEILAAAPSSANVFVLSDHGMHPIRTRARHEDARPGRSGGHSNAPPGVLIAAGPDISNRSKPVIFEKLTRADLPDIGSFMDITPTILTLLGLPVGRDMDGRVLAGIFTRPTVTQWVPTYTRAEWYLERPRPTDVQDPDADAERLEQLRALGYLD